MLEASGEPVSSAQANPPPERTPRDEGNRRALRPVLPRVENEQGTAPRETRRPSGLGIASTVLAALAAALLAISIGAGALADLRSPGTMDSNSPFVAVVGLGILGAIFVQFIGLGLGIAGLVQGGRSTLLPILGTVLHASELGFVLILIIVGNLVE